MQWSDDAIVLSARRHGESAASAALLTRAHGRHAGLVRGGGGRRLRPVLQPGNEVRAVWRARLSEHLGNFALEPLRLRAGQLFDDAARLSAVASACAILESALPEREPHPALFDGSLALLQAIDGAPLWAAVYVRWELGLLQELGFALDLSRCKVTGDTRALSHVSPRTGRAVSDAAAGPYRSRLLPLPGFLVDSQGQAPDAAQLGQGLALTGFFLQRQVFDPLQVHLPVARQRLVDQITRTATTSGDISRA